jgi:hypothetical protein
MVEFRKTVGAVIVYGVLEKSPLLFIVAKNLHGAIVAGSLKSHGFPLPPVDEEEEDDDEDELAEKSPVDEELDSSPVLDDDVSL